MPNIESDRERTHREDREHLRRLGYAEELLREMGGFSNFAVSFSVISVLTGSVLLYGYGLRYGGPRINTLGWPLVSIFVLFVAASMAEIASAYPTAGGLYYWAYQLGGRGIAWACAWLNLIGQITITSGINIAAAIYLTGLVVDGFGISADATVPWLGRVNGWNFWLAVMFLQMVPQVLINLRSVKLVARLSEFGVAWHIAGVATIALLLTFAGRYHNGLGFLLSGSHPGNPAAIRTFQIGPLTFHSILVHVPGLRSLYEAGGYGFCFVLGLLQAQWTYTGYDASAHLAEETLLARLNSAWGIFLSVAVSAVAGYILLIALTNSIPPNQILEIATNPYPVLYIARRALAPFLANVVGVIIFGAMWLCGLASITSMARMCFAFARDHGMPGWRLTSRITPNGTPAAAIALTSTLTFLVTLYSATYSVVTSLSTISLYLAYGIPIFLNWRNRARGRRPYTDASSAPWNLGRYSSSVNLVAIVWIAFITLLFSIPPNELAGLTMAATGIGLLAYWHIWQRYSFVGPAIQGTLLHANDMNDRRSPSLSG